MESEEEILSHTLQTFIENLSNSIKKGLVIIEGTVLAGSVDMIKYTCTVNLKNNTLAFVTPSPGAQTDRSTMLVASSFSFPNVPLKVLINSKASFIEIPADGTTVLMTFRDGNFARPQLLEVHECKEIIIQVGNSKIDINTSEIVFNGGSNGLPLSDKITTKLNNLGKQVNNLQEYFNTHIHTSAAAGSPTSPTTVQDTDSPLTTTVQSDIASTTIKQV
jgi:hypothetical protein